MDFGYLTQNWVIFYGIPLEFIDSSFAGFVEFYDTIIDMLGQVSFLI